MKKKLMAQEPIAPNSEFLRNFTQVPPMARPIPAPKTRLARENSESREERKPEVQI